jgi:hypothetical protein
MKRDDILREAERLVSVDRADDYGDARENFGNIANLWSSYLKIPMSDCDVAIMMTLLKIGRLKTALKHTDSWIDACGYMALGGELSETEE